MTPLSPDNRLPLAGWIELGFVTLIGGAAGVMVQALTMPLAPAACLRSLIGAACLMLLLARGGRLALPDRRSVWLMVAGGTALGLHWLSYFYAIRFGSVAVGMLTVFTFPVMIAVAEPLVFRERWRGRTLLLAGAVLVGVSLIVPRWTLGEEVFVGALFGLLSAACVATRTLLSRPMARELGGVRTMAWQAAVAGLLLSPALLLIRRVPAGGDLLILLALGLLVTAVAHTLLIRLLGRVSAAAVGVLLSAQPAIGVLLAWWLLDEVPTGRMLVGGVILLVAVGFEASRRRDPPALPPAPAPASADSPASAAAPADP